MQFLVISQGSVVVTRRLGNVELMLGLAFRIPGEDCCNVRP